MRETMIESDGLNIIKISRFGACVFCRRLTEDLMCNDCASKLSDLRYTVPRWAPGWFWDALRQNKVKKFDR